MLEVTFYTACSVRYIHPDRKCWNASNKLLGLHIWAYDQKSAENSKRNKACIFELNWEACII